jgi:Ca2+-binding RTX toxin-like protein
MATINGTTGPDNIIVPEDTVTNIVNGLAGDDTITGSSGRDSINGDDGNDLIYWLGGQNTDTLNGGSGDDIFFGSYIDGIPAYFTPVIDGGEGVDTLESLSFIASNVNIDTANLSSTLPPGNIKNNIKNVEILNRLYVSNSSNNVITDSVGHNDDINLSNSSGNNFITSNGGNDSITITIPYDFTISSSIFVDSGNGDDRFDLQLNGDNYSVILDGGEGTDTLRSIFYNGTTPVVVDVSTIPKIWNISTSITIKNVEILEFLETGAGNDIITDSGSLGHRIYTRGGDDQIFGGTGNDDISAGSGNDLAFGGAGADTISGSYGNDNLEGNEGNDSIFGNDGDDGLAGQEGDDNLGGGDGNDRLYGWTGNDTLYGDDSYYSGQQGGDDKMYGDEGNDFASGGTGNDFISGGTGDDTLYGDGGFIYFSSGSPEGDDTLYGDEGNDFAYGGLGNDFISGGDGIDNLEGNKGNDTILGDEGDDGLAGQEGDDSLVGGNGNDRLYGWLGNDTLQGDGGDDTLYGGSGNDRLTGGAGADTFNFGNDFVTGEAFNSIGLDTITDFQSGLDKIQLQRSAFSALPETLSFAIVADDSLAATSSEIIVYSQGTGSIFYNANGSAEGFGNGGSFAQLTGNPSLAAIDFNLLPATVGSTGFAV